MGNMKITLPSGKEVTIKALPTVDEIKKLHISDVSGSVSIIDVGNINYHLKRGGIEHTYFFLDENKEYARCLCGRTFFKKSKKTNNNGK